MLFMKDYVIVHFNDESISEQIGYPQIEEHKDAHAKFKQGIDNYVKILKKRVSQRKRYRNRRKTTGLADYACRE